MPQVPSTYWKLLHSAIRKDRGNGLVFYDVLESASAVDCKRAIMALSGRFGRIEYTYPKLREEKIKERLRELMEAHDATE